MSDTKHDDGSSVLAHKLAEVARGSASSSGRAALLQEVLALIQEQGVRRSDVVMRLSVELVERHAGKLSDSVLWSTHERIVIAALDAGDTVVAKRHLGKLQAKFSKSVRVRKLVAMQHEAAGEWAQALATYAEILVEDPINTHAMKRRAAVERARGNLEMAVKELTNYCKVFCADESAWLELADIYIQIGDYALAAFCLEELLLLAPENYLYHLQYAEILYSQGGRDSDMARQYFAQSLELKPVGNMRAATGLFLCLQRHSRSSGRASLHSELLADVTRRITGQLKAATATSLSPAAATAADVQSRILQAVLHPAPAIQS